MRALLSLFLLVLLGGCSPSEFEIDTAIDETHHLKREDYYVSIKVRGNTASKKILLYVQGGPGYNSLDFAEIDYPEWRETLEKTYAVAYYDQYGMGNRQGNIDVDKLNNQLMVAEIKDIAHFLSVQYKAEIILLGHSYGGGLTLRYALEYPNDPIISKYINMNGPATTDNDEIRWVIRRDFLVNLAEKEIAKNRNVTQWKEAQTWLNENRLFDTKEKKWAWNDYINELVEPLFEFKTPGFKDYAKVVFASSYNVPTTLGNVKISERIQDQLIKEGRAFKLIDKLGDVEGRFLLLTGSHDDICPPEELSFIYDNMIHPNAKVDSVILPMAAHDAYLDQKEKFYLAIKAFVD